MCEAVNSWGNISIKTQLSTAWGRPVNEAEVERIMQGSEVVSEIGEFALGYAGEQPEVVVKPQPGVVSMIARFSSGSCARVV